MGLSGISPLSLLIILVIVLVLFGGKRLRNLGTDLGGAIKGFRSAVKEADGEESDGGESEQTAAKPGITSSSGKDS